MRPLRLVMTAFGPFPEEETIDFRVLGASRLFLIHGETGAGKSTILDGLCAALYGESTGGERTPEQMRSDHARPETATVLELDFAIGGDAYRIQRTPRQRRPRKRGGGFTEEKASATLWRLSGPEPEATPLEVLAERKVGEVDARVMGLLGFDAAQFRQVVVLPQGQFRRLLSASSDERERIFERLFDTDVFSAVERELKDRANALRAEVETAVERRLGKLESEGVSSVGDLEAKVEGLSSGLSRLEAEERAAQAEFARAQEAWNAAVALARRFSDWERAAGELHALESMAGAVDAERGRRDRARRAREIEAVHEARARASHEQARRVDEEKTARATLGMAEDALRAATENATSAAHEHALGKARREEVEGLRRRVEQVEAWEARRRVRADRGREAEARRAELGQATDAERALRARHESRRSRLGELGDAGRREAESLARVRELEDRLRERERLERSEVELERARQEVAEAAERVAKARALEESAEERCRRIREALDAARAALLAQGLVAGAPCPVCGSTTHPRPAAPGDDLPSDQETLAAEEARRSADASHLEAEHALAGAASRLKEKEGAVGAQRDRLGPLAALDAVTLRADLEGARDLALRATRQVEERRALEEGLTQGEGELAGARKRLEEAGKVVAAAEAALEAAAKEEEAAARAVGAEAPSVPVLRERLAGLERAIDEAERALAVAERERGDADRARVEAATRLDAAMRAAVEAEAARVAAETAFSAALARKGFPDVQAFENARLAPEALTALEREIADHDTALAAVRGRLDEHARDIGGRARPDVEARRAEVDAAETTHARLRDARVRSASVRERSGAILAEVRRELVATAVLEERYGVLGDLARVADGQNPQRLSLHRFVLSVFLEDVLDVATQHLRKSSRGRYDLVRRADVGDLRSGQGLDLDVFDHHTGERRSVATLSGGEGFLAALALALGLADVVQSYAGGRRLETVFVDEGFGSLDPETLDLAVETLLELQAGGRMVGVISHVAELKERIDVRLEVVRGEAGSRTRFHVPA